MKIKITLHADAAAANLALLWFMDSLNPQEFSSPSSFGSNKWDLLWWKFLFSEKLLKLCSTSRTGRGGGGVGGWLQYIEPQHVNRPNFHHCSNRTSIWIIHESNKVHFYKGKKKNVRNVQNFLMQHSQSIKRYPPRLI